MDGSEPFFSHCVILSFPRKTLISKVYSQLYARDNQHSRGATNKGEDRGSVMECVRSCWRKRKKKHILVGYINLVFALLEFKHINGELREMFVKRAPGRAMKGSEQICFADVHY